MRCVKISDQCAIESVCACDWNRVSHFTFHMMRVARNDSLCVFDWQIDHSTRAELRRSTHDSGDRACNKCRDSLHNVSHAHDASDMKRLAVLCARVSVIGEFFIRRELRSHHITSHVCKRFLLYFGLSSSRSLASNPTPLHPHKKKKKKT